MVRHTAWPLQNLKMQCELREQPYDYLLPIRIMNFL